LSIFNTFVPMQENQYPKLIDNHGRPINYLRLAITDRCNLRCYYCMPENGIIYEEKEVLLSYEEMLRLVRILAGMGVSKVRITGGEPFVRKNLIDFLFRLRDVPGITNIHLTTNGVLTEQYLKTLKEIGIASINLSLDTLDRENFAKITRRDEFEKVMSTYHAILQHEIPLKLNCVILEGKNTEDIIPMVELARHDPVSVRFIEEMPFNGTGEYNPSLNWNAKKILQKVESHFTGITKKQDPANSTSSNYQLPGFKGDFGIIAAYSRTFCGTCDRIRVTAQGNLKTCLYDGGTMSIRDLLRSTDDDELVRNKLAQAISKRAKDGFEAEKLRSTPANESMSTIGG